MLLPSPRAAFALVAALALAACGFPYTPRALPPVTTPAPAAALSPSLPTPFGGGAAAREAATLPATSGPAPVILISLDGFRADYLDRGVTPNLGRLAAAGVRGDMRPAFPSKTFPNHWSIVTGVVPDRHGIIANSFDDPARPGEHFTMASDDPFWWNAAEPIWVTAERAGIRTATMFWPGSSVAWGGARASEWPHRTTGGTYPHDWWPYGEAVSEDGRVRALLDWMRRPAAERPRLSTLYFEAVDSAGHQYGPDAPETMQAVAGVDRAIGALVAGLAALGQPANIVVVADHGMAATSSARVIALDTIVPPADATVKESGPYATLTPVPGREAALAAALTARHPHMQCWPKAGIPARFHYGRNPRIPPFLCLAETGWVINKSAPDRTFAGGNHGYDNRATEMRAVFVASGPAFIGGRRLATFDVTDVNPLLRDLIGLPAGVGLDGSDRPFRGVLRRN